MVERDDEKMSADWSERVKAEKPQLEAERGMDGWTGGGIEGWMNGGMEGWTKRGMEGGMVGWTEGGRERGMCTS